MYNEKLNNLWINRLKHFVRGKRVIIVGNSHSMMNEKYGEFIDSFDVVVRFGRGHPTKEVAEYIGTKHDVWISGSLRLGEYKKFETQPKFKIYNLQQLSFYDSTKNMLIPKDLFYNTDFQIYRDFFLFGDFRLHKKIVNWGYDTNKLEKRRMANGVMAAIWFMNSVRGFKECHVIGFDFMQGAVTYDYDGDSKRQVSCGSWHMPYSTFDKDAWDPHDSVSDEAAMKKLVNKRGLIFHEMDHKNLNLEKLSKISETYRPEITSINPGPGRKRIKGK